VKGKSLGLIIAGGLLVGIGLGLVQAGIRRAQGCDGCDESPEDSAAKIAKASAEKNEKEEPK
jgi:hypothetical protein